MSASAASIVIDLQDGILRVEIRRPEKKNALTGPMYAAMADAFATAERDPGVRVLVIHGQPGMFTAGNDLSDFLNNPPISDDPPPPVFRFLEAIRTFTKPLVAAVAGVAVGVGTTMLLHCDLIYAGESAKFQLPFVNLGLCPEAASSLLLPGIAGHTRAAEILLLGESFGASTALQIGLVNAILPDDRLLNHAMLQARKLTAQPAASLRLTKQLMKRAQAALVEETMREEGRHFKARLLSPESREAFTAFLEKRKPDFSRFN